MEAHNLHLAVMQMIEQAHSPSSHSPELKLLGSLIPNQPVLAPIALGL